MVALKHYELCVRAVRWLRGTKRCNPAFSGNASCSEIPDAIGWSADGSIVVECKTSILDFYGDEQKYVRWKFKDAPWPCIYKERKLYINGKYVGGEKDRYERVVLPNMGDYRYFMCEPGIIEKEHMEKYPGHGLVHVINQRCKVILPATQREAPNLAAEIRYLRFAIVNGHCCRRADAEGL